MVRHNEYRISRWKVLVERLYDDRILNKQYDGNKINKR